jgi:hypothetical protein
LSIPKGVGGVINGMILTKFDENGCDAVLASISTGKLHVCQEDFKWSSFIPPAVGPMVKMDAQLFLK